MKAFLVAEAGSLAGQRFVLQGKVKIGRATDAGITVADKNASRYHAELLYSELQKSWILTDLGSTNGTSVNGERVSCVPIEHGALIEIGESQFRFIEPEQLEEPAGGQPNKTMLLSTGGPEPGVSAWQTVIDVSRLEESGALPGSQLPAARLNELVQIGLVMSQAGEAEQLFDRVTAHLAQVFSHAEGIAVLLAAGDEGYLDIVATRSTRSAGESGDVPLSATIVSYAVNERRAVVAADVAGDERFSAAVSLAEYDITSAMCAPMVRGDDVLGVVYVAASGGVARFNDEDLAFLNLVASQLGLVVTNSRLVRELGRRNAVLEQIIDELTVSMAWARMATAFREQMSRVVPAYVLRAVAGSPAAAEVHSQEKDLTVLHLDVHEMATLRGHAYEDETGAVLKRHLAGLVDIIRRNGGEIAENDGTGLVVVFENEDAEAHAAAAIETATGIRDATVALCAELPDYAAALTVNMGLCSGPAEVAERRPRGPVTARWSLTVAGSTPGIAAELAGLAQDGQVLIADTTAALLQDRVPLESIGERRVLNGEATVYLFTLL